MTPDNVSALRTSNSWAENSQDTTPTKQIALPNTVTALPAKQDIGNLPPVTESTFAQLGLWFKRYPTPTEVSMAASEVPIMEHSPNEVAGMDMNSLGMNVSSHTDFNHNLPNEMSNMMGTLQNTMMPVGMDLSTATAINLIKSDWMTPNSSISQGSVASSAVSMPVSSTNNAENGYLQFNSFLSDNSTAFDPLPQVDDIHARQVRIY
ncbi:hypothetical protein BDF19DRAFT_418892 [Syncephalis fuscata]|nr:hypothetical protein BDF19DRAFT_418892 [Syncephalis fuscata]